VKLKDDDPLWAQHDGGSGHRDDPDWNETDAPRASAFYATTKGRGKAFLDLMIDRPGELLDADWIASQIAGPSTDGRADRQIVARALRDLRAAQTASGRRYPFYWWSGRNGSPTQYAMKPTVAGLFRRVRPTPGRAPDEPTYWWDGEPDEKVFMEITRREDIGADLNAPLAARGGAATPGYALVAAVRPGDIIVHYDSRDEEITGVSVATGNAEPAPNYWVARGTSARRAGEQARWLPGIRVPLGHYRELDEPITLTEIRAKRSELLELREQLQKRARGRAIYFPWIPYQDTLRTFQSYLVKLPLAAVGMFAPLHRAVEQADMLWTAPASFSPAEQAQDAVDHAAGKTVRRGRGQGFQLDQAAKVAVETHAMNMATEFYSDSWDVEDVHGRESYDLVCRSRDEEMRVEVKGTTTSGTEVILTPNEVRHAREYRHTALFVLSDISLSQADGGVVVASGGVRHVFDPWDIDHGTLEPIGFRYQPPTRRDQRGSRQ
jgi:hypothetical protein